MTTKRQLFVYQVDALNLTPLPDTIDASRMMGDSPTLPIERSRGDESYPPLNLVIAIMGRVW